MSVSSRRAKESCFISTNIVPQMICGELYYRQKLPKSSSHKSKGENSTTQNFHKYLSAHDDAKSDSTTKLSRLQEMKRQTRKCHESDLLLCQSVIKQIETRRDEIIIETETKIKVGFQEIVKLKQKSDHTLERIINEYGKVVFLELSTHHMNSKVENNKFVDLINQSKLSHELQLFSELTPLETKHKISLSMLPRDSDQHQRCRKAIKENVNQEVLKLQNISGIKVISVSHLQNANLSESFQVTVVPTRQCRVVYHSSFHRVLLLKY